MPAPRPPSLRRTLVLRQTILLTLLLVVIGTTQLVVLRSVLLHTTAASLRSEVTVLEPIIHHSLTRNRPEGFSALAALLLERLHAPGVEVIIANRYGMLMANSSTVPQGLPPPVPHGYVLWQGRVVVSAALGPARHPLGTLWLLTGARPLWVILRRDMEVYGILSLVALTATAVMGLISVNRSLEPLARMLRATSRIAAGNYGATADVSQAPEELARLGEAINTMSQAVADAFAGERASQEQMRRFLADASHELRTPLTAIRGFLGLMAAGELDQEESATALAAMREQAARMQRLVESLLTLSRLDASPETQVRPQALDLAAWLRGLLPTLTGLYGEGRVVLEAEPVTVWADPERMQEVLFNLLDNAHRYTPAGQVITVSAGRADGTGVLTVRDRGPGIREQDLPHLFERFYRGDRGRSRHQGGAGLGLAIVRASVEAQKGTVTAANRTDGTGASFRVRLPLAPSRGLTAAASPRS